MKYGPDLQKQYEKLARLRHLISERGSTLNQTLLDNSMDTSSERIGGLIWSPDGLRFSIERWLCSGNLADGKWGHYRESDVVVSPAEVESVMNGE